MFAGQGDLPRLAPGRSGRGKPMTVCALDVGSSKMACLVARLEPLEEGGGTLPGRTHSARCIGFGHQRSRGVKSGAIVDMDAAEGALRLAVDAAERSSGQTVDSLIVSVSAGRLSSRTFSSAITLDGDEVGARDLRTVLRAGAEHGREEGRTPLHSLPINYTLDGQHRTEEPTGLVGRELGVDMHVLSAEVSPLRNLEACINRSHLTVDAMVAAPYAAGLSSLVDDEARMGCACIDMGAGTTTVSIFLGGRMVFADAVAIGGQHVTMDLARILSTPVPDAERLKVLHATVDLANVDERETVGLPGFAEDEVLEPRTVPATHVAQIVRSRIEEVLELVRARIARSGFAAAVGRRVVLTGGASQLPGLPGLAASILQADVRVGRPLGISGLPGTAKGPAFAASAGLIVYPQVAHLEHHPGFLPALPSLEGADGTFGRLGRWLKEAF